jgi:hypothetical protein
MSNIDSKNRKKYMFYEEQSLVGLTPGRKSIYVPYVKFHNMVCLYQELFKE